MSEMVAGNSPPSSEQPVAVEQRGGRYALPLGEGEMVVDAALGGRIVSVRLGQIELLTGPEVVAAGDENLRNMFGSTFWTSPQAAWSWPPEPEVDREPYEAVLEPAKVRLSGRPGALTGYSVTKHFSADRGLGRYLVEYELVNERATQAAAPWEISRVPKRGLVFFPAQSGPTPESSLSSRSVEGVAWVDIAGAPAGDSKLFQDGSEGWLAYASQGLLLIKTFENVPRGDQAEGEAEVEIFVSGNYDYVELEQQGRYQHIGPMERSRWSVGWWVRRVPEGVQEAVGSASLVRFVRDVLATGGQP